MSKTTWAIFYIVIVFVDIVQAILNFFIIGVAINRGIDIIVGVLFPFSLHMCGISMTDPKRALSMFGAFGIELMPGIDTLPLWTLELIFIHIMYIGEEKIKARAPKVASLVNKVGRFANIQKPLNDGGVRLPRKPSQDEEVAAAFSNRDTI